MKMEPTNRSITNKLLLKKWIQNKMTTSNKEYKKINFDFILKIKVTYKHL